ncbi:MAG: hypothetical protein GY757_08385 [bacterium]|nr:hypothetical protein [bacterium]
MVEIHWDIQCVDDYSAPIFYKIICLILIAISIRALYLLLSNYYQYVIAKKELKKWFSTPSSANTPDSTAPSPFEKKRRFSLLYYILSTLKNVFSHPPGSANYNLKMNRLRENIFFLFSKGSFLFFMGLSTLLLLVSAWYEYVGTFFNYKDIRISQQFSGDRAIDALEFFLSSFGFYTFDVFIFFIIAFFLSFWAQCNAGRHAKMIWFLIKLSED